MGVKYILSHEDDLKVDGYELINKVGDVYIYRNIDTESIARFYTSTITEKQYKKIREDVPVWNLVEDVLITHGKQDFRVNAKDLLAERSAFPLEDPVLETTDPANAATETGDQATNSANSATETGDRSSNFAYHVTETGGEAKALGSLTLPLDTAALDNYARVIVDFDLQVEGAGQMDVFTNDHRKIDYFVDGSTHYKLLLPKGTESLTISARDPNRHFEVQNLTFYGSDYEPESATVAEVHTDRLVRDDLVTGTVDARQDGYLMLAMPYQEGWSAYLDDVPCEQIIADYGFTAIRVSAGSHTFRMEYHAPLIKEGVLVSGIALLIWAGLLIFFMIRRKRKDHA